MNISKTVYDLLPYKIDQTIYLVVDYADELGYLAGKMIAPRQITQIEFTIYHDFEGQLRLTLDKDVRRRVGERPTIEIYLNSCNGYKDELIFTSYEEAEKCVKDITSRAGCK